MQQVASVRACMHRVGGGGAQRCSWWTRLPAAHLQNMRGLYPAGRAGERGTERSHVDERHAVKGDGRPPRTVGGWPGHTALAR